MTGEGRSSPVCALAAAVLIAAAASCGGGLDRGREPAANGGSPVPTTWTAQLAGGAVAVQAWTDPAPPRPGLLAALRVSCRPTTAGAAFAGALSYRLRGSPDWIPMMLSDDPAPDGATRFEVFERLEAGETAVELGLAETEGQAPALVMSWLIRVPAPGSEGQ
ncbi:MAG: hypothetical protein HYV63_13060 [Candidatus Schekmanbacteria bacterium]|nr:hypothetical protein [Candidatus Schekmanbacteria bacterium]